MTNTLLRTPGNTHRAATASDSPRPAQRVRAGERLSARLTQTRIDAPELLRDEDVAGSEVAEHLCADRRARLGGRSPRYGRGPGRMDHHRAKRRADDAADGLLRPVPRPGRDGHRPRTGSRRRRG